jgi:TonB family protein
MPMDDNLDRAFAETNSFTDTMTDIAASVGKSVTGAAGSVAGGAHDILASLGETDSAWKKPKNMAIGGGAALALAIVGWFVMSGESTPEISDSGPAAVAKSPNVAPQAPPIQTSPAFEPPAATTTAPTTPDSGAAPYGTALERARAARDAGNLISPPESNAVELYVAAAAQAAGDPQVEAELQAVVDDVLGVAERAIMARNANEADTALDLARFADPGNSRLNFLTVQVNELLLRDRSDSARVAIRESRFEDAGRLIAEARGLAGADTVEVDLLTEELNTARSQQQVGETIATANARLEAGNLVTPANDNARYYFELALSNDPQNQAAQQGLITVASKLVLQARDAIDNDQLDAAEGLLDDASILDPSSAELSAAVTALTTKRNAVAEAARLAEAERVAALERQREATRQAERERVAEEQRQAVAAEQAELDAEQQANRAATASPLGVGAAAPKVEAPRSEPPVASRNSESSSSPSTSQSQAPSPPPIQRNTTPVVQASVNRQPPAPVQTQSASAVHVQGGSNLSGSVSAPQQVAMVPISQLTRINYVGPEYPRAARRRDVTGAVSVGFIVTTDGRVRSVSVISSEPGDTFDQAAMDAVEQWRFEPVIENGIAVEKRSAVRLAFNLQ